MTQTPHLALPLLDAAQAQKHVTHNEALSMIDALAHLAVSGRMAAPPAAPNEGDRVLVATGATGAFAGKDRQVAAFLAGAWTFLEPQSGWRIYVGAESLMLLYNGADWIDLGAGLRELQNLTRLGVGTTADTANPLSAKINSGLFAAKPLAEGGTGDLRLTLNKEGGANTLSLVYQSNFSGRAEAGLTGNNDYRVKVSVDGAIWKDAIVVDRNTGAVSFPSGGPAKIQSFVTSGVYTPTPGMRFVDVVLFGAGGGGGSGARQAAGASASGGGGGGGGGIARGRFTSAQIGASRAVTIGAAGAGGAPQSANGAPGLSGTAGGDTSFGTLLKAFGGGAGSGGGLSIGSGGGGGSGFTARGNDASAAAGGGGSQGQGNGGSAAAGGGCSLAGHGAGGGGGPNAAAGAAGGNCINGPSGGGAGGGISAANATSNGGLGGAIWVNGGLLMASAGVAGGVVNGGAGAGNFVTGSGPIEQAGAGGGGGASGLAAPGAGGAGGFPGGGGGGGGAAQNGALSGAGGSGGAGFAMVIEYF
ncbi:DUF2793 domain-containing protein [Methylocystis parvus]|uniref:DUF2793 domain-containing protein n=1 Tax=Methylocystis parvus TaxID=134 RepID=UPI003C735E65